MAKKKKAPEAEEATVRLDPDLPLLPGNSVTFVARVPVGIASATVETDRGTTGTVPSLSSSGARVTRIIETYGAVTVRFFEDGVEYASGTFGG